MAVECRANEREDFEAFLEASIVFSRSALQRMNKAHSSHPRWKAWWNSLRENPSVVFFWSERDWILHEAPPKLGQRGFAASMGSSSPSYEPSWASEFYFFTGESLAATETVERNLREIERLVNEGEALVV
jgi:hypothetical protein